MLVYCSALSNRRSNRHWQVGEREIARARTAANVACERVDKDRAGTRAGASNGEGVPSRACVDAANLDVVNRWVDRRKRKLQV